MKNGINALGISLIMTLAFAGTVGANTLVETAQYQSYTIVCDGTQWWIL